MIHSTLAALLAAFSFGGAPAAPRLVVTAVNPLGIARAHETLQLTRDQLAPLGEKDLSRIHVTDAAGRELIVQPVDTDYDDYHTTDIIIFQSDFAPHERKQFTVTTGPRRLLRPEDYRAYGRFVRERFDDFAWENDVIAHRTYGKALETWKGEPLTSSAIDIWSKLTPRLIVNEWYMMGDPFYHEMHDNGGDDYSAGSTRGDGGNGLWDANRLWVSRNFVNSRELANGPIRVMFELDYEPFEVNGRLVAEVMRVTLDAGSQLDHYHVRFVPPDGGAALLGAIGFKTVANDQQTFDAPSGVLTIWEPMEKNRGMQGLAGIVDPKALVERTDDPKNHLLVVRTAPDHSMDYWAGFAWDKAGRMTSAAAWQRYVADFARGIQAPIEVTVSRP